MLRKTLVILRVLFVSVPIIYLLATSNNAPPGGGIFMIFLLLPVLAVYLAFTTWIDSIDARLNPKPQTTQPVPFLKKDIGGLAIIIPLLMFAIPVIYYLLSSKAL